MTISTDSNDDKKQKLDQIARRFSVLDYLQRRAARIMESRQAMARIASAIRESMFDISHLLAGKLSAGGQADLEHAVSDLQGLTKAADQARVAAPSDSGDSGAGKTAQVDLSAINVAVEARRDSYANASQASNEGGLQNVEGKTRKASAKAKALSSLDAMMAVEEAKTNAKNSDASTPSDDKLPVSDGPVSKADRFKLAFATSDSKADPSSSANSGLPLPATSPSARSNAASLKLDHAEAIHANPVSKVDASASTAAPIAPPEEGTAKARPVAIQPSRTPHKPSALAAI